MPKTVKLFFVETFCDPFKKKKKKKKMYLRVYVFFFIESISQINQERNCVNFVI